MLNRCTALLARSTSRRTTAVTTSKAATTKTSNATSGKGQGRFIEKSQKTSTPTTSTTTSTVMTTAAALPVACDSLAQHLSARYPKFLKCTSAKNLLQTRLGTPLFPGMTIPIEDAQLLHADVPSSSSIMSPANISQQRNQGSSSSKPTSHKAQTGKRLVRELREQSKKPSGEMKTLESFTQSDEYRSLVTSFAELENRITRMIEPKGEEDFMLRAAAMGQDLQQELAVAMEPHSFVRARWASLAPPPTVTAATVVPRSSSPSALLVKRAPSPTASSTPTKSMPAHQRHVPSTVAGGAAGKPSPAVSLYTETDSSEEFDTEAACMERSAA